MPARIVTLTTNPAVDVGCLAPVVRPIHKIRTSAERFDAGGGGINVSKAIHSLGGDTIALVMTGGSTGRICEELLSEAGVPWRVLPILGRTRICLNVQEQTTGLEYRFVPEGPFISESDWKSALQVLRDDVGGAWLVASGSLPRGVPCDFYAQAASVAHASGREFALDTSGQALKAAIDSKISLLKLSLGELEFLAGCPLRDAQSQEDATRDLLQAGGIRTIAVSLGVNGAFLAEKDLIVRLPAIPMQSQGAAGAGDSFLGGLILALTRGLAPRNALGFAIAAGAAAVSAYGTAQVSRRMVEELYKTNFAP